MRHVVFHLDKDRYALPLSSIREVVPVPAVFSRVPRSPASVRGVFNLRGRVVMVIDLQLLLDEALAGARPAATAGAGKIVLLDRGRRELGLLVTEVDGIERIEKVAPAPARSPAAVKGLARLGALAVTVLDPEGIDTALAESFTRG